ncbi:MAG TPA: hypothetical protein VMV10_02220 [Pirellulales bacterium]|nr:hypothetical protein [Pirellulales bacterium]
MDAAHALSALRSLTADAIRTRLEEIDAEAHSLRILLRSAIARERAARNKAIVRQPQPEAAAT